MKDAPLRCGPGRYLAFRLARICYCLDSLQVLGIENAATVTPIMHPFMSGVMGMGSATIFVLDPRPRLDLPPVEHIHKGDVIVAQAQSYALAGPCIGLLVDEVTGMLTIGRSSRADATLPPRAPQVALVLNLNRILTDQEIKVLPAAAAWRANLETYIPCHTTKEREQC